MSVGGHICLAAVVTGKDQDCVVAQVQLLELVSDQAYAVIDAFQHRRQVWIMVDRPVIQGVALKSLIFAQVTVLSTALAGSMLVAKLLDQLGFAVDDRMGSVVAEVQEERLIVVSLDKVDRFSIHAINEEFVFA